jgi:hypothetical protein
MVVPGSHKQTMAAAAQTDGTRAALGELRNQIGANPGEFGIDTDTGVEIPASAGSLGKSIHILLLALPMNLPFPVESARKQG